MKKSKKILAVLLSALTLSLSLVGCAGSGNEASSNEGKVYNIGICQLVTHDALDAATNGFKEAVVAGLGEENVKFIEQGTVTITASIAPVMLVQSLWL